MYINYCCCPQIRNDENKIILTPNKEVQQYDFSMSSSFLVNATNADRQVLLQMSVQEPTGAYNPVLTQVLTSGEEYKDPQKVYPPGTYSLTLNCSEKPYTGCNATVWIAATTVQHYL